MAHGTGGDQVLPARTGHPGGALGRRAEPRPAAGTIRAASRGDPPMTADDRPMRAGDLPTRSGDMPINPGDAPTMARRSAWRGPPLRPMAAAPLLRTACCASTAYPVLSARPL